VFPICLLNHTNHIYLDSNPHIELCSANLEAQDAYWAADIDFSFAKYKSISGRF